MFQGELFTYARSEDSQLCVINYLKCQIETNQLMIVTQTSTDDKYKRIIGAVNHYLNKPSYNNISFSTRLYEYDDNRLTGWGFNLYFEKGYVPVLYRNSTGE